MTPLEEILSRALLVRERAVPRDVVPSREAQRRAPRPEAAGHGVVTPSNAAAEDLRALCETLVVHTPAEAMADFVTDQVPEPRSALVLACVLQLTDTGDGARFWWQYAAGAGQPAAAYCLYLHHLALGEEEAARWWHDQADDVEPPSGNRTPARPDRLDTASTTTMLRILRRLAKNTARRPRPAVVTELMTYMPTAVAVGYLREPDMELPLPGPGFATTVRELLVAVADRPDTSGQSPARTDGASLRRRDTDTVRTARTDRSPQLGETAKR
ncbi:hypothetical protein OHA98_19975 [Streptomyces sp. NBC_00654]|uniref:hypothetical protein n=1 Tax=Streptomyces sp. NBC_00654 TaxID=2975799 RepID=UPI002252BD9B|nr:hypothetical protein [Streptomyces sp. NBC_00654]MCX4967048.1 hypothetical protein [Streptomyces sp. NBC_00654]